MARRYFGCARAKDESSVTVNGSAGTTGLDVEISFELTTIKDRVELVSALRHITNVILRGNWPPA